MLHLQLRVQGSSVWTVYSSSVWTVYSSSVWTLRVLYTVLVCGHYAYSIQF
jgi:hypothetical protein